MANRRLRRRSEKEQRHATRLTQPQLAPEIQLAERVARLAYTREQAAKALGVSLATLDRRVIPVIATVRTESGARLILVAELERYLAERRQEARAERRALRPGRKPGVPPELITRICREHAEGESLAEIARRLNTDRVPTSQGGRQWWPSTVRAVLLRPDPPGSARASPGSG